MLENEIRLELLFNILNLIELDLFIRRKTKKKNRK